MTVPFIDTWVPNGPFAIARNGDVRGGIQVVATADAASPPVVDSGSTADLLDPSIALRGDIDNITGAESWMEGNAVVQLSGTSGGVNDGEYLIDTVISPTRVRVIGSFTFPEANNGSLVWEINPYTDTGYLTQGVATWLREPSMAARVSPPETGVDSLVNSVNDYELRRDDVSAPVWQDRLSKAALVIPPQARLAVEAVAGDAVHRAHIVHGCSLDYHQGLDVDTGFYRARADLEPGMLLMADGRVVRVPAAANVTFGVGGTPATGLDGVAPSFPAFVYYYVYAPVGSTPTLTFSTSGPDAFNRPSSVPGAGDRNDYVYVGFLRWHDYRVATGGDNVYELQREARVFETVMSNKRARTVYFSDPFNDADFTQTDSDSGIKALYTVKNFQTVNPAPAECRYVIFDNNMTLIDLSATGGNFELKMGGGICRRLQLAASGSINLYYQSWSEREQLVAGGSSAGWGQLTNQGVAVNVVFAIQQCLVGGVEFVD